jgi:type IV fimbrial biogenesis protein FimT
MYLTSQQRGFSIVEIAVALAVLGIGLAFAMPSYTKWIANAQIRNRAESISFGLQQGRAEAIKRGGLVEFLLTTSSPTAASEDSAVASSTGENWIVRAIVDAAAAPTDYAYVSGQFGTEGAGTATVAAFNNNLSAALDTVTFDALGRIARGGNDNGTAAIEKICVTSASLTPANGARILEIDIGTAGQIKMCDPSVVDASDPRRCVSPAPRCS